jgi:hypothetical protein
MVRLTASAFDAELGKCLEVIGSENGAVDQIAVSGRANLDIEMMRDDPPWAPVMDLSDEDLISRSFGCRARPRRCLQEVGDLHRFC